MSDREFKSINEFLGLLEIQRMSKRLGEFHRVSEHFFILKFLRKLYIARTKQPNIFTSPVGIPKKKNTNKLKFKNLKYKIPEELETPEVIQHVNIHYPIKLSFFQNIGILFS